jgi:hypothetical protein
MAKPIVIPLGAGAQTELADILVTPGATLAMENCVSEHTGAAHVRLGADVLSTDVQATVPAAGTLPSVWQLGTLGGELVRFNRAPEAVHAWLPTSGLYARSAPDDGGLVSYRRGPMRVTHVDVMAGVVAGAQVSSPSVGVGAGYAVVAHEYTNAGSNYMRVEIVDLATKKIARDFKTSGAHTARVIVVGSIAVVAYVKNTSINVDTYDLETLTLAETATFGDCDTGTIVDIRAGGIRVGPANPTDVSVLYTFDSGGGSDPYCLSVDATDLTDDETNVIASLSITAQPDLALGWLQDIGASGKFSVMAADTTNGLYVLWDLGAPAFGTTNAARTDILDAGANIQPSGTTPGIRNVIGSTTSNFSGGNYRVVYEIAAPDLPTQAVLKTACASGAPLTPDTLPMGAVGIRSKLWRKSTDLYFLTAFAGTDQATYFVNAVGYDLVPTASSSPAALAVAYVRSGGGVTERIGHPTDVGTGPDGELIMAVTFETRTESIATSGVATGATSAVKAIGLVVVEHREAAETQMGKPVEFIGSLFTPGGAAGFFDGRTYGLPGFAYYPPPATAMSSAGGNLEHDAEYFYRFCYSFIDRSGRKWRSTPSAPQSIPTSATDWQQDISVETLRQWDRGSTGVFGVQIEAYRSQANETDAFFLVASIPNNPAAVTVTFTDNVADDDLGEELYTDGGGLENQLLPSIDWCLEYQGRLVCGESGTGTVWYSLEADLNHGLIFNEALTEDIGDASDASTGGAVFGDLLFVFKNGKYYIVSGQGADALGKGGNYTFRLVEPSVGCSNPQSIAVADDGVWFKSSAARAGIHRTNGGAAEYVGAGVHDFDDFAVTSAVVIRDRTEIRFYTEQWTTLVWNWTTKAWGWNILQPCLSAISGYSGATGVVYARASDGYVVQEATVASVEPYQEAGVAYSARIRTPWYRLGGALGGFGRIRRIQGVGGQVSPHRLVVNLYKNQEVTPFQTASIVFDAVRHRWDWEIRPAQQPMSSIMLEFIVLPYQAPSRSITPGADSYSLEPDLGIPVWIFEHGDFTGADVGSSVVIVGSAKAGTYTIVSVIDATTITMMPSGGGFASFSATTITVIPALSYTIGPEMVAVALLPSAKEGMDKLPASRRLT